MIENTRGPSHQVVLVRHAETQWSKEGRHTSFSDLPLTSEGREKTKALAPLLAQRRFELILTSPSRRALETCRILGYGDDAETRADLREWNYGDYEGVTTAEIREHDPGWILWSHGAPGGESPPQVQERVDRIVQELMRATGDVIVFGHGHLLRALGARWINLPVGAGRHLRFATGGVSTLGWEREIPVIDGWNLAADDLIARSEGTTQQSTGA